MYFFFDATFAPQISDILNLLDVKCCHLTAHFPKEALDEEWIPFASKEEWVAVTGDFKIWKNPLQRETIQSYRLKMVFMPDGFVNSKIWSQVQYIIKYWPSIEDQLVKQRSWNRVRFNINGKIEVLD